VGWISKGTSQQHGPSPALASSEYAFQGRLGWARAGAGTQGSAAGFSACVEGPGAGGSALGRAQHWQQRGWVPALLPPSCISPSPICPQLRVAPVPAPFLPAPLNPFSPSSCRLWLLYNSSSCFCKSSSSTRRWTVRSWMRPHTNACSSVRSIRARK